MNTPIIFMGAPWVPTSSGGGGSPMPPFDWNDIMLKSVYDTDNDGAVEKVDTLSGIQDLGPSPEPNKVVKTNSQNQPYWGDDESLDDIDGGVIL